MSLSDQVAQLEQRLSEQQQKTRRTLVITTVVYVLVVIAVVIYTQLVYQEVKKQASRQAVADYLTVYMAELPRHRAQLLAYYEANADRWAEEVVVGAIGVIPALENRARMAMDETAAQLAADLKTQIMPPFTAAVKEQLVDLKSAHQDLSTPGMGEAVAGILVESIEKELDQYINDEFVDKLNELKVQLIMLSKEDANLTYKQNAQRVFLQCFWHLQQSGDTGESVLQDLVNIANERWPMLGRVLESLKVDPGVFETFSSELVDPDIVGDHELEVE